MTEYEKTASADYIGKHQGRKLHIKLTLNVEAFSERELRAGPDGTTEEADNRLRM